MISKTSGFIHTVAGTPGVADCGGDNILPTFDKLSEPVGLVVDTAGNIYIADTDSSLIRMVTTLPWLEALNCLILVMIVDL